MKTVIITIIYSMFVMAFVTKNSYAQQVKRMKFYVSSSMIYDTALSLFLTKEGVGVIRIIGQKDIDPSNNLVPNLELLKKSILNSFPDINSNGFCLLDWEGKGMQILYNPQSVAEYKKVSEAYIQVVNFAKQLRPNVKWGFYGLPFRSFWNRNLSWQKKCENLEPLLSNCDVLFPSLYILYSDAKVGQDNNSNYIKNNVTMALKVGQAIHKPVFAYITHRLPNNELIPEDQMLRYVNDISKVTYNGETVSGIVWWGNDLYDFNVFPTIFHRSFLNKQAFIKYHDSLVIRYCNEFLKQLGSK